MQAWAKAEKAHKEARQEMRLFAHGRIWSCFATEVNMWYGWTGTRETREQQEEPIVWFSGPTSCLDP